MERWFALTCSLLADHSSPLQSWPPHPHLQPAGQIRSHRLPRRPPRRREKARWYLVRPGHVLHECYLRRDRLQARYACAQPPKSFPRRDPPRPLLKERFKKGILKNQLDFVNHQYDPEAIKKLTVQRAFAERWAQLDPKAEISVHASIEETINQARGLLHNTTDKSLRDDEAIQVFITGSLHLVGGALGILEGADAL